MDDLQISPGPSLLLVDDNVDLAQITQSLLNFHGFEVSTCFNGKECLEAADSLRPDIIITDIDMPVMDGVTACNLIREQPWGEKIGIIALSGNMQTSALKGSLIPCFDAQLRKPAQFDQLIETIWEIFIVKSQI